jgi:hypothetical protein
MTETEDDFERRLTGKKRIAAWHVKERWTEGCRCHLCRAVDLQRPTLLHFPRYRRIELQPRISPPAGQIG